MTIAERQRKNIEAINNQIDSVKMAYKIKDSEGNTFVFARTENGFPVYRTSGGSKVINDLTGYSIIEKHLI